MSAEETVRVGALQVRSLVDSEASNGTHTVIEVTVPPGAQVPAPHSHQAFEETFVGMAGELTVTLAGVEHQLTPGDAISIASGQVHGFHNASKDTARFLGIAAPGVFGWPYFQELAVAFDSFGDGPPDRALIADIMRRHGLTPAPAMA